MKKTAEKIIRDKTAIVLQGGGSLGIGHVGTLSEWEKMGGYQSITHVCGSSVGSILAAAIAAKASVPFMKETIFGLNMKQFADDDYGFFRDIYRLYKKWGWHAGDAIEEWAEKLMFQLTGNPKITMEQLYDLNKIHLTITYFSYRYRKTKYADHTTQPDLCVAEAIRMSSSIPIYYQAVWRKFLNKNQQDVLDAIADGGTMDNFPIGILHRQGIPDEKIMGFKLCSTEELNADEEEDYDYGLPNNAKDAITVLIEAMREQAMRVHVHKNDWKLTVKIDCANLSATNFSMTDEQKNMLFSNGKRAMRDYAKEVQKRLDVGEKW